MTKPIGVVIVDDHAIFSEALAMRIDREPDIRVVGSTCSPFRARVMIAELRPQVLLLDVELGHDDGLELIAHMRATPPHPKVVVLTGHAGTDTALSAFRNGASAFVPKTAPVDDLLAAVRTVSGGEYWASPAMLSRILPQVLLPRANVAEDLLQTLSDREREVLDCMAEGLSNAAIAERLYISILTVRTHVHNLQKKLRVHSKLSAVALVSGAGASSAPCTRSALASMTA